MAKQTDIGGVQTSPTPALPHRGRGPFRINTHRRALYPSSSDLRMNPWLSLTLAIILEVIATTLLKISDGFSKWLPATASLLFYGVSFYLVSLAFRSIPVGTAYAIWSGCGIVLISLIGISLGQKPDPPAVLGIALIVAGVAVINLFSKTVTH